MDASEIVRRNDDLTRRLEDARLGPTCVEVRRNGAWVWKFCVDDRDDAYVEVASSVRSGDYLLVRRDGEDAAAYVFQTLGVLVAGVARQLELLAARRKS